MTERDRAERAAHAPLAADDETVVARLKAGDESAFALLIDQHNASMLRLAMSFVGEREVAEEIVQETWLAVLRGIDRFEGRSSLKLWIFRILANRAKELAARERPSSFLSEKEPESAGDVVNDEETLADAATEPEVEGESMPDHERLEAIRIRRLIARASAEPERQVALAAEKRLHELRRRSA